MTNCSQRRFGPFVRWQIFFIIEKTQPRGLCLGVFPHWRLFGKEVAFYYVIKLYFPVFEFCSIKSSDDEFCILLFNNERFSTLSFSSGFSCIWLGKDFFEVRSQIYFFDFSWNAIHKCIVSYQWGDPMNLIKLVICLSSYSLSFKVCIVCSKTELNILTFFWLSVVVLNSKIVTDPVAIKSAIVFIWILVIEEDLISFFVRLSIYKVDNGFR